MRECSRRKKTSRNCFFRIVPVIISTCESEPHATALPPAAAEGCPNTASERTDAIDLRTESGRPRVCFVFGICTHYRDPLIPLSHSRDQTAIEHPLVSASQPPGLWSLLDANLHCKGTSSCHLKLQVPGATRAHPPQAIWLRVIQTDEVVVFPVRRKIREVGADKVTGLMMVFDFRRFLFRVLLY